MLAVGNKRVNQFDVPAWSRKNGTPTTSISVIIWIIERISKWKKNSDIKLQKEENVIGLRSTLIIVNARIVEHIFIFILKKGLL